MQSKWYHNKRNLEVGDIVIISEKDAPRCQWKMGKISNVEPGIDTKVQRITVQYKHKGSNKYTEIERPVQKLVLILPIDEQNCST